MSVIALPGARRGPSTVSWPVFWQWFGENAHQLKDVCSADVDRDEVECVFKRFHAQLTARAPGLVFEVGLKDGQYQFVVSADGNRELINAVLECVNSAPDFEDWQIIAFRQPESDFSLSAFGVRIDHDDVRVIYYADEDNENCLAVYFIFRTEEEMTEDNMISVSCLILDGTLGEFDAMTEISSLGVHRLESGETWPGDARPIAALAAEIGDRTAARTRH
jgi:hypothetical protein